jgi:hypothetical protein
VLVRRAEDGVEVELGPVTGGRSDRWTRAEAVLGLLVIVGLAGGILIKGLGGPGPGPSQAALAASAAPTSRPQPSARGTSRPSLAPTSAILPAMPCATLDTAAPQPGVSLVVDEGVPIKGTPGPYSWYGVTDSGFPVSPGEAVDVPFDGVVDFAIDGDACATRWTITAVGYVGPDPIDQRSFGGDEWTWASYEGNRGDDPVISQQNRIAAQTVGLGVAIVEGTFAFADGGSVQMFWRVRIAGFEAPDVRVTAADGSSVQPIVGCGRSYNTPDQYIGEQCDVSRPPLLDGPVLSVPDGSVIDVEVDGWAVTYWSAGWVDQATVVAGGDLQDRGNFSGYDQAGLHRLQWFAPPLGDWNVQLYLNEDHDGSAYSIPFLLRVRVV